MKISAINPYYQNYRTQTQARPTFQGFYPAQKIGRMCIGMAQDGIIGKVSVFDKNMNECFLNVVKDATVRNLETYMLKDNFGRIIGDMEIEIVKNPKESEIPLTGERSWVFVKFLSNNSKPNAKYHKSGLSEYKGIGTRLMQIAQRRSDEAGCCGNIHLRSFDSSMAFYKKLGFREVPTEYDYKQSLLYLPPEAKEPLSKLYGGL